MIDHDTDAYYKIGAPSSRAAWAPPRAISSTHHALLADRHRRLRGRSCWDAYQAVDAWRPIASVTPAPTSPPWAT